ncbi:MAG: DUF2384 domain-containing protein [Oscillatoria princeps RMCB-10]|nr:DUF2384 domain-containing protein [Oscillatoria princeps RMCB-10]
MPARERMCRCYTEDSQQAIPMNPTTNPESAEVQDYQARHEQLIEQLRRFMGGQMRYVEIWLNSPHPDLGGLTPQFFIDAGKIEVVESLAWAMEVGQPG